MSFRPTDIGMIFGQDHLQDLLISWVEDVKNIPQQIMFAGPFGTGKTTIARILAGHIVSSVNDLKEINAADARGIDDVRGWADSARFSPLGNGGKVYIIDELHQMTTVAQSALLKILEEPPSNVFFFLCTTEPHKLLPALRSRCTHIELRLLDLASTCSLLNFVYKRKLSREILEAIHYKSGGHARDAVKMADVALMTGTVTVDELDKRVGYGRNEIENLIKQIITKLDFNLIDTLLRVYEVDLVAQVIDSVVDDMFMNENVMRIYSQLLPVRVSRREYKLSSSEQIKHFISMLISNLKDKVE